MNTPCALRHRPLVRSFPAGHYRASPRLFHWAGSSGVTILRQALTRILHNQYSVQIVSEHHLTGAMSDWPVIIVPGWEYLEPAFRDELAAYAKAGGQLLLIGPGPAKLFERKRAAGENRTNSIVTVNAVDDTFSNALEQAFLKPIVRIAGSHDVDISLRTLNKKLTIHLVNTSSPHANPPVGGITEVLPIGPLTVAIHLPQAPKSITQQPEGRPLTVTWDDGRATVKLPQLKLYSILVVEL